MIKKSYIIFLHIISFFRPNVCVERGSVIDGQSEQSQDSKQNESSPFNLHIQSTQCSETETSFECITKITSMSENKTNTVKYQCCHGFVRPNLRSQCTQSKWQKM